MAKLNQCENCKDYQANLKLCTREWKDVCFDDTDCKFKLDSNDDSVSPVVETGGREVSTLSRVSKRGSVRSEIAYGDSPYEETRETHSPKKKVSSSSNIIRSRSFYITVLFCIILLVSGGVGVAYYKNNEAKELSKAQIICLLDEIQQDKTLNSIRMIGHHYESDSLVINYFAITPIAIKIKKDSLRNEFQNMVLLYHDKWKEVLNNVCDKQSVIVATFNRYDFKNRSYPNHGTEGKSINDFEELTDTLTITIAEVKAFLDNQAMREKAIAVFANRKIYDIEEYVKIHYGKTSILKMHSVTLDKDFVRVALSFDDSKSRIGSSLLDSTSIDPNFIDKVGERGSILKEIFSICSRTHRGFTIEYIGSKKGTHHVLSWNYDRAMEFKPLFKLGTNPYEVTNQSGVTLVRERNDQ